MKKFALLFFCSSTLWSQQPASSVKLQVVTTLPVLAQLAKEVGGSRVSVDALTHPDQDPHFVQPTPTLMKKVRSADVFVEVGLDLELWAQKVIDGSGNVKVQRGQIGRVVASSGVHVVDVPSMISREFGDVHPYGNPHIWLDPIQAIMMAKNIATAFARVDIYGKESYERAFDSFQNRIGNALFGAQLMKSVGLKKLTRLAQQDMLDSFLKEKKLEGQIGGWLKTAKLLPVHKVVTYHRTWPYFAARFGIEVPIEIEEKSGIAPSPKHRDRVIETMKEQHVKIIAIEPFYDRSAAEFIAKRTDAKIVASMIDVAADTPNGYFRMIDGLFEQLAK